MECSVLYCNVVECSGVKCSVVECSCSCSCSCDVAYIVELKLVQCTSSSGPALVCFVQFDLEMCFLPTGRAMFHLSSGRLDHHTCSMCSDGPPLC